MYLLVGVDGIFPTTSKPRCWREHSTGANDVLGRLEWHKPSVTIRTEFFKPEKGRYLHPSQDRALTHAEAAVIQGFDDRHLWCGSKLAIAKMIGNAVPPPLAEAIADKFEKPFKVGSPKVPRLEESEAGSLSCAISRGLGGNHRLYEFIPR